MSPQSSLSNSHVSDAEGPDQSPAKKVNSVEKSVVKHFQLKALNLCYLFIYLFDL